MRRRRLLSGAGAGLSALTAGCLELPGVLGGSRAPLSVSLTAVDDVGAAHPFELVARVEDRGLGPDATPTLAVGLESTAEEALYLGYDDRWPADGLLPDRDTDPPALRLLATAEATDFTVEHGPCPATDYRPGDGELVGYLVEPGERLEGRFVVLGRSSTLEGTCPRGGRYRIESTYPYTTGRAVREVGYDAAEKRRFRWGFTLAVSERT